VSGHGSLFRNTPQHFIPSPNHCQESQVWTVWGKPPSIYSLILPLNLTSALDCHNIHPKGTKNMYNLTLLVLGKLKEKYWQAAEQEYLIRLAPYAKIKTIEILEEPFHPNDDKEKIKKKEAEKILAQIKPESLVIALEETGKQYTSLAWSELLSTHSQQGKNICLIVGGPLGLHESIKKRADFLLSLSSFTFTHQLARLILLEQIYRAATITAGKTYHY